MAGPKGPALLQSSGPKGPAPTRISPASWLEREQHVARDAAVARVAGRHEHHPAGDHRPRSVDRPALRLDAIDGVELAHRIEVPDHAAVARVEGAHVSVIGAGEDDARDRR